MMTKQRAIRKPEPEPEPSRGRRGREHVSLDGEPILTSFDSYELYEDSLGLRYGTVRWVIFMFSGRVSLGLVSGPVRPRSTP